MGGNAFAEAIRIPSKDILNILKKKIFEIMIECNVELYGCPPEFSDKNDFGDLDILFMSNSKVQIDDVHRKMLTKFNCSKYTKLSNGLTFLTEDNYQIDVSHKTTTVDYWNYYRYHSYNYFHHLLGIGLKYTQLSISDNGLNLYIKCDYCEVPKKLKRVNICRDFKTIYKFLQLPVDMLEGADYTKEQIHKVFLDCKWTDMPVILKKNRKNKKVIKATEELKELVQYYPNTKINKDTFDYFSCIVDYFFVHELVEKHQKMIDDFTHIQMLKEEANKKLNGNILIKWYPELDKKRYILGDMMRTFRKGHEDYYKYICETDIEQIKIEMDIIKLSICL